MALVRMKKLLCPVAPSVGRHVYPRLPAEYVCDVIRKMRVPFVVTTYDYYLRSLFKGQSLFLWTENKQLKPAHFYGLY